jgi:YHS domain-containing protein
VKVQPGVSVGDRTYCPVSGVVFEVKESSAHRDVGGKPVYFCCEKCATYFSEHQDHVVAVRSLAAR